MGYSVDTGRNVYLQPSLASQGVKGTVTNALASAFVGSLGGGKSFCNNLLVYYAVLFGGQALLLDPKSERGNWKETLPEIAHEINIVVQLYFYRVLLLGEVKKIKKYWKKHKNV